MIKIGVTGGIGSGKSTVCGFFEELGIAVYYSDLKARTLMESNSDLINSIISEFGIQCYQDNKLNRQYISSIIFRNAENLQKLNKIVHPVVIEDFINWGKTQLSPYVIMESALIYESGIHAILDKVICVTATNDEKIERIAKRDMLSKEEILNRINSQMPDFEKAKSADFVIVSGNKTDMKQSVFKIHADICKEYKISKL